MRDGGAASVPRLFDGRSSPSLLLPFMEVRLDGVLPVLVQGCAAPDGGHSLAHHLVIEAGARAVAVVVHRPVGGDAQAPCHFHMFWCHHTISGSDW